jgi:hypothetical protein
VTRPYRLQKPRARPTANLPWWQTARRPTVAQAADLALMVDAIREILELEPLAVASARLRESRARKKAA